MAKYEYTGDNEVVFPTLGIIAKKGDVFEAPEGLTIDGVVPSGKKVSAATVADEAPVVEDVK